MATKSQNDIPDFGGINPGLDAARSAAANLEKIAQKQGDNIVIDFGFDRFSMYTSFYGFGGLMIMSFIVVIIGPVLICDPPNSPSSVAVAEFTNTFCWGSWANNESACKVLLPLENLPLRETHSDVKFLYLELPYLLVIQFFGFLSPWVYWHYISADDLHEFLKYMGRLLKEIYTTLKVIKRGLYKDEPFDRESKSFKGSKTITTREIDLLQVEDFEEFRYVPRKRRTCHLKNESSERSQRLVKRTFQRIIEEDEIPKSSFTDKFRSLIAGNLKDRHLFSMFCFENFRSKGYLTHIKSVFKMTKKIGGTYGEKPDINYYDMNEAILYQWCHRDNLINNVLVLRYFAKHYLTVVLALINIILMTYWMMFEIDNKMSSPTTYRCYLPHQKICVLCSINGRREALIIFFSDYVLVWGIFLATSYYLYLMRGAADTTASHYFEIMRKMCSVVFLTSSMALKNIEKHDEINLELKKLLKEALQKFNLSQLARPAEAHGCV